MQIVVLDYGVGNLHSISKALQHVGGSADICVTSDADTIYAADKVVFPGVGGIGHCIAEIHRHGLADVVRRVVDDGKPTLGICVGLQALLSRSEENGGVDCLDILQGEVRYFGDRPTDPETGLALTVPHMGWNNVNHIDHPMWANIDQGERFYFVHSFYSVPEDTAISAGTCRYGREFTCALVKNNLFATQFHPEKSQHAGLQLLKNFVQWDGRA